MIIQKKYHFYAAHRNKEAGEKCARLHGHTYYVTCHFQFTELHNGVGMLFSDIDAKAEPVIKQYDHYMLLHEEDSLCEILDIANEKYIKLPFQTSAENMAVWLFTCLQNEAGLPITRIELGETTTSTVIYEPQRI